MLHEEKYGAIIDKHFIREDDNNNTWGNLCFSKHRDIRQ